MSNLLGLGRVLLPRPTKIKDDHKSETKKTSAHTNDKGQDRELRQRTKNKWIKNRDNSYTEAPTLSLSLSQYAKRHPNHVVLNPKPKRNPNSSPKLTLT